MALAADWPATSTSKIVLWPLSEYRIFKICLGSNSTATASCPEPYSTAGILPATRTLRAAFLLNLPSRGFAITTSGISVSRFLKIGHGMAPLPLFWPASGRQLRIRLVDQRAYARLHVNALDGRAEQAGNRQHL